MALKSYAPGQSGNPGGRPKMSPEMKEALSRFGPRAIEILTSIAENTRAKDADRIRAAEVLLDRYYGKPVQQTELTGEEGTPLFTGVRVEFVKASPVEPSKAP